ncbi:unnamed protein product [Paramecium primaurelia]|uniref:STOP protein n=1 Tax=Paramecium primaurelia TaxID=5886 RepID=A0A8S1N9U4_PARPR|nr:unnamed protein product [Paramecium primaurelia]
MSSQGQNTKLYTIQSNNSQTFTNKPRMVKYQVLRKQNGLGSRIIRQLDPNVEEQIIETCKSLMPTRPDTQQSKQKSGTQTVLEKPDTREKMASRLRTPKSEGLLRFKSQENQIEDFQPINQQFNYVDEIPLDHPIWKLILPDVQSVNIPKLINDNPDYFHHQLGFCACYKCECGQCKCNFSKTCKLNYSSSQNTVYGKDFLHKQTEYNALRPLNQTYYSTQFCNQKPIDQQSLHQTSYKQFKVPVQEMLRPQSQEHRGDFLGNSSYKTQFKFWGPPETAHFKRPVHQSVSDQIPFTAQSLYQDSFANKPYQKPSDSLKMVTELTPLPTGQPFVSQSQTQLAYQPFRIQKNPKLNSEKINDYGRSPKYDTQYKSLVNTEYTPKRQRYCPAKEYIAHYQQRALQKLKQQQ